MNAATALAWLIVGWSAASFVWGAVAAATDGTKPASDPVYQAFSILVSLAGIVLAILVLT